MNEIDILVPLGSGSRFGNAELRFALRSICRHARGWRRVMVVGENPGFLSADPRVSFFPIPEATGNKEFRIAEKVRQAFLQTDVSDYVAFWNDDYVLRETTDVRKIPFHQNGPLIEASFRQGPGRYKVALQETHEALTCAGRAAMNYDVHLPMIYHRQLFLDLARWWEKSRSSQAGLVVKSTYANNILPTPGPGVVDCKLRNCARTPAVAMAIRNRWVFSYSDKSLETGLLKLLKNWFPDPCDLEVGRAHCGPSGV